MATTWTHPQLGEFTFDGGWTKVISMPAFKAFAYDTGLRNAPRSDGRHELEFEADDKADLPSPTALAVADAVLAHQADLVPKVVAALWDDFNGRGPSSGMWWRGDLDAVAAEMGEEDNPPGRADDLLNFLHLSCVRVRKWAEGHDAPVVELCFHAAFELEHNVGVLTDGHTILGIGHSGEVTPFGGTD